MQQIQKPIHKSNGIAEMSANELLEYTRKINVLKLYEEPHSEKKAES